MSDLNILHGCCTLQLTRGLNTLIDVADSSALVKFNWNVLPSRNEGRFYAVRNITIGRKKQRRIFLHRILIRAPEGSHVDHRNGDGLDNRRENLRLASPSQNTQNTRRVTGASRYKGVVAAGPYWRARIRIGGALIQLGCHRTQEAAARAYDAAAVDHFGPFACTNRDMYGDY